MSQLVTASASNYHSPFKAWVFTINNTVFTEVELKGQLSAFPPLTEYVFQKEQGESGTPHFQGLVRFCRQLSRQQFVSSLPLLNTAHFEHCKTVKASRKYCSKALTRIGN